MFHTSILVFPIFQNKKNVTFGGPRKIRSRSGGIKGEMLAMQPLRPDQSRLLDPLAVSVHPADDDHAHDHAANRSPAAAAYEVYTRRWLMLALFSFLSLTNAMVW